MRSLIVASLVVTTGCVGLVSILATRDAFRALPEVEREAFDACYLHLRARNCPRHDEPCGYIAENYVRLGSTEERRTYLVQAGCPEVLVASVLSGRRAPVAQSKQVAPEDVAPLKPAGSP